MENFQVYRDIQARTGGDIYIGVVGPVRTGKSTFIRRFMELVALPEMEPAKQAEVRLYENLIDEEKGVYNEEDGSMNLNPNSLEIRKNCFVEPNFEDAKASV